MKPSITGANEEALTVDTANTFRFISIQNPNEAPDRQVLRSIRSHAVREALQNKRRQEKARAQHAGSHRSSPSTATDTGTQTSIQISSPLSVLAGSRQLSPNDSLLLKLNALLTSREHPPPSHVLLPCG
jgi:hypothetical protein